MLQLNLLPDVKKEFLRAQRMRNIVITVCTFATVAAVAVLLILGGVMGGQALVKSNLTNSISNFKSDIAQEKTDKNLDDYLTVQNQLRHIDDLKAQHMTYSRLLGFLKQLNPVAPNNVSLSAASISGTNSSSGNANTMTLTGTTASFASLDKFKNILASARVSYSANPDSDVIEEPLFDTASILVTEASLAQDSGGVNFTVIMNYNTAVFSPNAIVQNDGNLIIPSGATDPNLPVFKEGE